VKDLTILTLLSDFGLKDPYVSEMKGTILSLCPEVTIVDISHNINKYDVLMGAFVLSSVTPYFPPDTIHVAVIDPGVGTKRNSLIVKTKRSLYVGPDNGLLILSAEKEEIVKIFRISNQKYLRSKISKTFHGRDVFCMVAAHLAKGTDPSEFGPEIKRFVSIRFTNPKVIGNEILGKVIYIDSFGNAITNISTKNLETINVKDNSDILVKLKDSTLQLKLCLAYEDVPNGTPLAIIGSREYLEISINKGQASKEFGLNQEDSVLVSSFHS
jgi:S-adenosylmethionine hydrolase